MPLTPHFTDFFTDFEKKTDCFAVYFCAPSGAGIGLNFWKELGESRYPGTLSPVLENFRPALSPGPTDCPWVSED